MTRKLLLILFAMVLALSACSSDETGAMVSVSPTSLSADENDEPAMQDATPYPEVDEEAMQALDQGITPYPEPGEAAIAVSESTEIDQAYPGPEDVVWPLMITDDLGHTIELQEYPKTIVSLSPSMTEILFAIGAGDQVVGRDDFSLYPESALEVESVGSLWEGMPTETILAKEPDLVVVAQILSEEEIRVLLDLGLPVYWQSNPENFDGLYENLLDIAEITGHTQETSLIVADLKKRVDAISKTMEDVEETPTVFYELDATEPSNPWTTGSGTFIDYIIKMAGGLNAASALQGDYAQISAEELIEVNPDIILLGDALYGITPESVAERPGWNVIAAVQNGLIFPIDPNMMSVPGPRLVNALEETAKLIHPELFE